VIAMRATIRRGIALTAILTAVVSAASATSYANDNDNELAEVRAATAQYHRHQVAVDEGFDLELADQQGLTCIEDPGGAGAMGTHWVNLGEVLDGEIHVTEPEVLLYDMRAPQPQLLGVEYVVFVDDWEGGDPPTLFGHEFHLVGEGNRYGLPPFYELHAWIWQDNPNRMFEDWNPRIDC
jgi:hypothetical protein